jgi:hypothetical protein
VTDLASPYKGLVPFEDTETDALLFFGREAEREIIAANLKAQRVTILYGPSGVGKSSVLQAGVAHALRLEAERNGARFGAPELAVIYYADWSRDARAGLAVAVADEVQRLHGRTFEPLDGLALHEALAEWTERLGGTLYIVLDQLEEYFLYHGSETGDGSFVRELALTLAMHDLPIAFLLSVREDSLASLDVLKRLIPNLFGNLLRLERLDYRSARAAIVRPLEAYSRIIAAGAPVTIEDACVEEVLAQVASGRVAVDERDRRASARDETPLAGQRFETPYLQLVLRRLWDEEQKNHRASGPLVLRRATLDALGGADRIVRTHLDSAMSGLRLAQQHIAARAFRYLVTPSNTKVAYTVSDLAEYSDVPREQLSPVLNRLAAPELRILRKKADAREEPAYEIFHDTLAPAVLDWRARWYIARRMRRVRMAAAAVALLFASVLVAVAVTAHTGKTGTRSNAFVGTLRGKIVASANWGVVHRAQIHFSAGGQRLAFLTKKPYTLPLYFDSSAFVTWCYWTAGAPNPNGTAYSLANAAYSGTLLAHMKHIARRQVLAGDVVIFGAYPGFHVTIVVRAGADPLLVSMGDEAGPVQIPFSEEHSHFQGRPTTWLTSF